MFNFDSSKISLTNNRSVVVFYQNYNQTEYNTKILYNKIETVFICLGVESILLILAFICNMLFVKKIIDIYPIPRTEIISVVVKSSIISLTII